MLNKIVEVKHLSHKYSVDWAIRDINFAIKENGVFGLLGSNGAGKSTTMNIICNVLTQTEGDVFINGINLRERPIEAKKFIGFLPQKAPLHTEMTVDEYLYHCADIRLMPKKEIPEAMERAKAKCGITHFSKRQIRNLSGGYQQRVGIAQAIIHNPLFVILDEPTNGLDPNQIMEVRRLIQEIAKDRAVLISTHILPEVQAVCDYIMMIEHGQKVFEGTINAFNTYMSPSALLTIMHNAPSSEELMKIEGVERVERLTNTRIRLHFKGDDSIIRRVVEQAVSNQWHLREISLEKESLDKVFAKLSGKDA
ncbi:MAG: ABC transporter ATP-binding protein [Butyricimonas faecihominis]|mgnify:FL=1|jgi:ABC transporter|uniref:ABC-2 type transport system ATP-binding protein n=1 Tax=Butyricimonas faecihominis TaxID=1472416 RepID=A0A7W6HYK2_9BACT|nr:MULTISPECIES: ABC transporter ATP-binding protein [Butyricimonas]MBS6688767.1 ABC transporter ATP-binding protein [Sanguibacteroides justesenii]KAB1506047.1 ABC transporter ATP-binding protein [Butyricimonas faecihominis]MBB4027368.1 ABC-2 type transport system ATP-binding protein [Butyricimonas faecihominis]WOF10113.1 ABC transporter ATP-binding protein [Butyricimonas faecihominis]BEI57543.1 ATP-binding cassette domain-containing protein [Butyricimonas faecihominis]